MYMIPYQSDTNYFLNGITLQDLTVLTVKDLYSLELLNSDPKHLPFDVSTIIPSTPYIFPIRSDMLIIERDSRRNKFLDSFSFTIPDDVIKDVKNNRCKILIDNTIESYDIVTSTEITKINEIIKRTISRYNLSKQDVIVATANLKTSKSKHYTVAVRNWASTLIKPCSKTFFNKQQSLILNKSLRPKKILTFMRKERSIRSQLAYYIYQNKLRDMNIVTFGKNVNPMMWETTKANFSNKADFLSTLPWHYDIELTDVKNLSQITSYTESEQLAYLETYINCPVEISIEYKINELDISEKTFKPIAFLQPFVVFGQPATLEYLKDEGYKTFDKWWDESYDTIIDSRIKFGMLTDLYKKLSKTSHSQLAEMLYEMWPILEHNYYKYCDYMNSGDTYQNLLKTISECFDK